MIQSITAPPAVAVYSDSLPTVTTAEEVIEAVGPLWTRAQTTFVEIGCYLYAASKVLPAERYNAMIETEMPFRSTVACFLKKIAESVVTHRVEPTSLPPDYTTAYHIVTLNDEELEQAKRAEIIQPKVTRKEIAAFKRSLKKARPEPVDPKALVRAKVKLITKIARTEEQATALQREIEALRSSLTEIEAKLAS